MWPVLQFLLSQLGLEILVLCQKNQAEKTAKKDDEFVRLYLHCECLQEK